MRYSKYTRGLIVGVLILNERGLWGAVFNNKHQRKMLFRVNIFHEPETGATEEVQALYIHQTMIFCKAGESP